MATDGNEKGEPDLIVGLASGASYRSLAETTGLSLRTIARRATDPDIKAEVEKVRSDLIDRAAGELAGSMTEASSTLRKLLANEFPPLVRLQASRSILEFALRVRDQTGLEQRLAELETLVSEMEADGGAETWRSQQAH